MKKLFYTIWISIYPVIIYTSIQFILLMIVRVLAAGYMELTGVYIDAARLVSDNGLIFIAVVALISYVPLFLFYYLDREKVRLYFIKNARTFDYIMAVLGGVGIAIILNLIITISGISNFDTQFQSVNETLQSPPVFVKVIAAGIIVPILEELIFRGLIFNRIRNQYNALVAMFISSIMFGIYHFNLTQGIYAAILGLCMVYVYNKVRTLVVPIMIHMSANISVIILGEISTVTVESSGNETILGIFTIILILVSLIFAILGIMYFKSRKVME